MLTMNADTADPLVSIIIPIRNGENWIDTCLQSVLNQTALSFVKVEVSVCDDASTDRTPELLCTWKLRLEALSIPVKIFRNQNQESGGVGYAKNRAVENSTGEFLCFQDVDDIMLPCRIQAQYAVAKENENAIVGGLFRRKPENATARFSRWANTIASEKLEEQIYTSHGPTIVMPTWFCHRSVFQRVGGFCEAGRGCPEDLIFFYSHLDLGGRVLRVDDTVLIYVYHPQAETFSICEEVIRILINRQTIWDLRVARLERLVLPLWDKLTIWNGGKQGRRLLRSLCPQFRDKVVAFCDVDKHKIGQNYVSYEPVRKKIGRPIPIIHFTKAKPPFIICVKMDMTNGEFERNLESLNLKEGKDYVLFS
ncbi:UDP-GlcNAc:betaGal beta-1,3-N-acetylglucosaminyltransferase-like protein 1 isoform X1 [Neodiprion lecontei]|uniref:UDP-GlcNAc:betaGal beta-1,3-N-acetylglucosaminyltransferase-like protein 1 isoform X1 n=1 Tax=Neodiprion lecontei TaxID=441921 RepID=A0ABM3FFP9_NEOLC|nr:UDP-GlcNAc:betaGal beta-1,3-N-acetylglucosaminyltransferase-like protein 1 isoform X1 [Neodiprion lecontei]